MTQLHEFDPNRRCSCIVRHLESDALRNDFGRYSEMMPQFRQAIRTAVRSTYLPSARVERAAGRKESSVIKKPDCSRNPIGSRLVIPYSVRGIVDPLSEIANTRTIAGFVLWGHFFSEKS
jgi:hypothetical protein